MNLPDIINAMFEMGGVFAISASILKLLRDREIRGYSWYTLAFFTSWGVWNVFYYPHLGQMWSFYAGIAVLLTNVVYLGLIIRFTRGAR
jgi:hypothetical protein